MCVRVHACACRGQRSTSGIITQEPFSLFFEPGSPFGPGAHQAGRLVSHRDLPDCLPSARITSSHDHTQLFRWILGLRLRFSCLYSKQLIDLATSPVPNPTPALCILSVFWRKQCVSHRPTLATQLVSDES